jgi:hypothetical protein
MVCGGYSAVFGRIRGAFRGISGNSRSYVYNSQIFCGTKNEIEKQAQIWLNTISMDLQKLIKDRYKLEIDTELHTARILYHKKWGVSGNPWGEPEGQRE